MNRNGTHGLDQQHIDWNVELRRIERQFDGLPPEPSASVMKARKEMEKRAKAEADARVARLGSALRLSLVASLSTALYWWPYGTRCGPALAGLVAAMAMVAVGGVWTAVHSWRHRLAANHAVAVALFVAGLALVAAQVLSRSGYARIAGIDGTEWNCPATGAAVATATHATF